MPLVRINLNTVIYPAPDVPGQWIAHCLETDIVTQGNNPEHARQMMDEALRMVAEDNVEHGRAPFEFRPAPAEAWEHANHGADISTGFFRVVADGTSAEREVSNVTVVASAS